MKKYAEIKIIGLYAVLFMIIIVGLKHFLFKELLNGNNFLNWDAEHYHWIKENGYEGFRIAFFPLFPLIWRVLHVDVFGIVLVNGIIFLVSFFLLVRDLKLSVVEILTYISVPSFIFFFLPYTESIFFLSSAVLLIGLKYDKVPLVCLGLFVATLSRPAFTIFIPALIISELLGGNKNKLLIRLGIYLAVTLVGMFLVATIQYLDTGEWFKFFGVQKGWGNELQFPRLPLTSWAGGLIVRLDGVALLIGVIAGGFLAALLLRLRSIREINISKEVIFSLAYLGGITLSVLIFRGGSLFSLNRFVFATPFIIVAFNFWFRQKFNFKPKQLLFIFGLIFLFWLLLGSYTHIQTLARFLLLTFYVSLIFIMKSDKIPVKNLATVLLILLNITFQIIFYIRFLNGGWVG
jgi:hypothetical protein